MADRLTALFNDKYAKARGIEAGIDTRLTGAEVTTFAGRKVIQRARATCRRFSRAYLGKNVVLINRRRLSLGAGVVLADHVRIDSLSMDGIRLEDSVTIDVGAVIRGSGGIRRLGIGVIVRRRAAIGAMNFIHGGGGVDIGEDCLLGPYVQIFSENHRFDKLDTPIIEQGETPAPVTVGAGSWIGASSIILAGVTIGEGAIVAAGSVVNRDVPARAVVAGNPARFVRMRTAVVDTTSSTTAME